MSPPPCHHHHVTDHDHATITMSLTMTMPPSPCHHHHVTISSPATLAVALADFLRTLLPSVVAEPEAAPTHATHLTTSPSPCHHHHVTTTMSPSPCHHHHFTITTSPHHHIITTMSPPPCHHHHVTITIDRGTFICAQAFNGGRCCSWSLAGAGGMWKFRVNQWGIRAKQVLENGTHRLVRGTRFLGVDGVHTKVSITQSTEDFAEEHMIPCHRLRHHQ
jgi:hypothetical protein